MQQGGISGAEATALTRAHELGTSVLGRTSPNPPVGAVILDAHGDLVGQGATAPAGGPHAEVRALTEAGARARGGTAVVTLEPCDHTGRTGPCSRALLAAGIARVVYAHPDPHAPAAGGAATLREHGVEVVRTDGPEHALTAWLHATRTGRPHVTWKFAATLDGRVAAADGTSRWITGAPARADVHRLRATVDAVVAGSGTVLADDPRLTVRSPDHRGPQPLRVVLDRRGRVPATARIHDDDATTLVLAQEPSPALATLYDRGVRAVLLEGGPTLAGAFVGAGLVDRVIAYLAPALLGAGASALGPAGMSTIAAALRLRVTDVRQIGADLRITLEPPPGPRPGTETQKEQ